VGINNLHRTDFLSIFLPNLFSFRTHVFSIARSFYPQLFATMKPISADIRDRALTHIDNGLSDRKIAASIGVSRFSVQKIRKQH
jgi:hypothetical protein